MEELATILGLLGAALIVVAYGLNQAGRLPSGHYTFPLLNLIGAALILWSLYYDFNLAAVVIEGFWLVISLFGLYRSLRHKP